MDHFAKPDDELAVAQRQGRLHRNFQGYSTHADCDLLGLGVSAIGNVGPTYSQNFRTLDEYYERLDRNTLPIMRGIELHGRRSGAPRGDPGADVPFRAGQGVARDRLPDRLRPAISRPRSPSCANSSSLGWSNSTNGLDHGHAARALAGAQHLHGVRPLSAPGPRAPPLLQRDMSAAAGARARARHSSAACRRRALRRHVRRHRGMPFVARRARRAASSLSARL